MEALRRAYNNLQNFVDDFANSTTKNKSVPSHKQKVNRDAWYAEWDDNYMGDLLNNGIVKSILRKIADKYYGQELDEILEQATELTKGSYPSLYRVYNYSCNKLGMYNQPKAYITYKMKGINALSLDVRSNQLILISPKVATFLSEKEQSFLLGHELSHHQQGNLVCHTVNGLMERMNNTSEILGPLVNDAIEVPLRRWCRCSEFNADKGGYICCGDLNVVRGLFVKLGMKSSDNVYSRYLELGNSHPNLSSRMIELVKNVENKAYQNKQQND